MNYVAIVTRFVHGSSGTELPPPVLRTETYGYVSESGETRAQFGARIRNIVLPLREESRVKPRPEYGQNDGFDWIISEVRTVTSELTHTIEDETVPLWDALDALSAAWREP